MKRIALLVVVLLLTSFGTAHGGTHSGDSSTVMNENMDELPPGCEEVTGWENITVRGGTPHAEDFPGTVFTYDQREFDFERCTRLTVTFINEDATRHQWMVHGLPATIHDMGMFTLDVGGHSQATGTFILPAHRDTLLVHCGLPQHMQKGMKAQIKVGPGDGNIPNIPGISGSWERFDYPQESPLPAGIPLAFTGMVLGGLITVAGLRFHRREEETTEEAETDE